MRDPILHKNGAGIYCLRVPVAGRKNKRLVSTGERNVKRARAVVQEFGADRLVHLANADAVTEEAIALITTGRRITANDVVARWVEWLSTRVAPRTIEVYVAYLRPLLDRYEGDRRPLNYITEIQLHEWVNDGVAQLASMKLRLAALQSLYKFANAKALIIGNPAALIEIDYRAMTVERKERRHHQPMSEADYDKARAALTDYWHDWLVLGYCTGARFGDLVSAEWASFAAGEIVLYPSKTGDVRLALPLSDPLIARPELQEVVGRLLASKRRDETFIWPEHREKFLTPARCTYSLQFKRQMAKLGINGITFHSTRTAFARRLLAAGKTIKDIARAMGHASTDTTEIYLGETP